MSESAASERYINRVLPTTADGYHGEAEIYLARGAEQFEDEQRPLAAVGGNGAARA